MTTPQEDFNTRFLEARTSLLKGGPLRKHAARHLILKQDDRAIVIVRDLPQVVKETSINTKLHTDLSVGQMVLILTEREQELVDQYRQYDELLLITQRGWELASQIPDSSGFWSVSNLKTISTVGLFRPTYAPRK